MDCFPGDAGRTKEVERRSWLGQRLGAEARELRLPHDIN